MCKSIEIDDWKMEFLIKSFVGRDVDFSCPESVIKRCVELAYRDMLAGGRYYLFSKDLSEENKKALSDTIVKGMINVLEKYNFVFERNMIDDVRNIFGDDEIIGDKGKNQFATRYGLAQKIVNMTFKYLLIFQRYIGKEIDFSNCDCPLDSIILSKIEDVPKVTWSKLDKQNYIIIQELIDKKLNDESLTEDQKKTGRLAYDFIYYWKN